MKQTIQQKERIAGIDIIKTIAAVFVVSIHQIGMTHIMAVSLSGVMPFLLVMFRYLVMACVPLFLMATGYLQTNKEPTKKFYLGLLPIIASYLFSSIFAVWVNVRMTGEQFHLGWSIIHILNFTENNYAWYVEMFIGLYLIIPFLNKAYHAIEKKSTKQWMLAILAFLTILSNFPLIFNTKTFYFDIMPDYWSAMYPVTYYFIGAYCREYRPRMNKALNVLLIAVCALIPSVIEFAVAQGGVFDDYAYIFNGFNSLSACMIATLIFVLFYQTDWKIRPAKAAVRSVSIASLEIYLWSNLVEKCVYPVWNIPHPYKLPAMIAIVFVLSFICAKAQRALFWCVGKLFRLVTPKKKHIVKEEAS